MEKLLSAMQKPVCCCCLLFVVVGGGCLLFAGCWLWVVVVVVVLVLVVVVVVVVVLVLVVLVVGRLQQSFFHEINERSTDLAARWTVTTTRRATTTGGSWCWPVHSRKLLGFNGSGSGGFWPTLEPLEPWKLLVCRVLESWFPCRASHTGDAPRGSCCCCCCAVVAVMGASFCCPTIVK